MESTGYLGSVTLITKKRDMVSGDFIPLKKPYYKRNYRKLTSRYYKKQANHAVRRYNKMIGSGNNYRRVRSFWNNYC